MRINCRWRTSSITQWKMPLAPSRLMSPNWPGRRRGEMADSPVKQVFHSHKPGTAGLSAGAEVLHLEPVWSVLQTPATLLRCLNPEGCDTGKPHSSHTASDSTPRAPRSHPWSLGLNGLNIAGFPEVFWSGICGNQECGHTFLFFPFFSLVPS